MILASLLVGVVLFGGGVLIPDEPCDPSETMCWMLPVFPVAPPVTNVPLALSTPAPSAPYMTHQPTQQAQIDAMLAPVSTANAMADVWLGEDGIVPDTEGGDIDTGLAPIQSQGSMLEYASEVGDQSGELFVLIRALQFLTHSSLGPFLIAMLAAAALYALVHLFIIGIQIMDMMIGLFDKAFHWLVGFIDLLNPFV
jgi:hypothetical protein